MAKDEEVPEVELTEETEYIVVSEDEGGTRMLVEIQGLRQDVQKVEAGLSAVLGLDGLRSVLEHGFSTNAKILEGFSEALKPPPMVLSNEEQAKLAGLFATFERPDTRDIGPIPSAVDTPSNPQAPTQFPDYGASTTRRTKR